MNIEFNSNFLETIKELIPNVFDEEIILKSKGLSQLGDSLINFIYSLSLSFSYKKLIGVKVPDSILANAYRMSDLKKKIKIHGDKNKIGDGIEALILWAWVKNYMSISEMVSIISSNLSIDDSSKKEIELAKINSAFKDLLNKIANFIE